MRREKGFYIGLGRTRIKETYEKWWLGKYCRMVLGNRDTPFLKVVRVEVFMPPSGMVGEAMLHFKDGTAITIPHGDAFRPRKFDVEVQELLEEK